MIKIKAHDRDLLNVLADKLAKESYRFNFPTLIISDNFSHQATMVRWAEILIDKPHRDFMKQLFQA